MDLDLAVGRHRDFATLGRAGCIHLQLPGIVKGQIRHLSIYNPSTLGHLAKHGGIQRVSLILIREIHHFKRHVINASLLGVIPQLQLGLIGPRHLDVRARGNGCSRIGHTCALATDKVKRVMGLIPDWGCGRHEEAVHYMGNFRLLQIGSL